MSTARKRPIRRVCFLNPHGYVTYPPQLGRTDTGGQTLYEFELAKALADKNIKVDIITRRFGDYPEEEHVVDRVRIVRVRCGGPDFVEKEKMYELVPEFCQNFLKYAEKRRKKYDLIHSHYWDGGLAGLTLARKLKIPHVHTPHSSGKLKKIDMSVEDLPAHKLKPVYRYQVRIAAEQKILQQANATVVICETNRIQLLQHYVVDFEKLHVIYPGIDTNVFRTKPDRRDDKIELKKNAILTMSRMVPGKGLDRVVEALALLRGRVPFHLYMGGSVHDEHQSAEEKATEQRLQRIIKRNKLERHVTLLGNVPHGKELAAYYRKADVFVLAARFEPFGLTTLEAMACGTPPIVSSVAGSREVVVDELNGFVVNAHDRKELAEAIRVMLKQPKKRTKVGDNAAYTIRKHFAWGTISDKFIALYKSL